MTPFDFAQRLIGQIPERQGISDHPFILWCLEIVGFQQSHDEVAWCSAFLNRLFWIFRLPRSKSAMARSWLGLGLAIPLLSAVLGDVVILWRGTPPQPGPENLTAQGHVGLFAGFDGDDVLVLAGNQSNNVSIARFPKAQVLGVRRITNG